MLQIRNTADFPVMVSSSYTGAQGRPLYVKLGPGENKLVGHEEINKWPTGAKENLAEQVQMGHLAVNELTAVHVPKDDGHVLPEFVACNLGSTILNVAGASWDGVALPPTPTVDGFVDVYNAHVLAVGVHTAVGTAYVAPRPTNLATLITYITNLQAAFDAHIAAAPPHANADAVNGTTVVAADLPTCIQALRELYGRFNAHKKQFSAGGAFLTPDAIIALT